MRELYQSIHSRLWELDDCKESLARKASIGDVKALNDACIEQVKLKVDEQIDSFEDYLKDELKTKCN